MTIQEEAVLDAVDRPTVEEVLSSPAIRLDIHRHQPGGIFAI
jgi:hypothetical protein